MGCNILRSPSYNPVSCIFEVSEVLLVRRCHSLEHVPYPQHQSLFRLLLQILWANRSLDSKTLPLIAFDFLCVLVYSIRRPSSSPDSTSLCHPVTASIDSMVPSLLFKQPSSNLTPASLDHPLSAPSSASFFLDIISYQISKGSIL